MRRAPPHQIGWPSSTTFESDTVLTLIPGRTALKRTETLRRTPPTHTHHITDNMDMDTWATHMVKAEYRLPFFANDAIPTIDLVSGYTR